MSNQFDALQERYQALVVRKERGETGEEFLEDTSSFIADVQRAGAVVANVGERSQLRAWMRFLANIVYDATGDYPDTSLQPLARGQLVGPQREREERRVLLPPLGWALVGAAVLVIVAGLFLIPHMVGLSPTSVLPTPTPLSPTPMGRVEVGVGRSDTGGLALQAGVFCTGTVEVIAQFAVPEPLPADAHWGWQLSWAGKVANEETSLLWETESTSRTVEVALPGDTPLAAGQYELVFLVDGQPVANRIFEVLAEGPRVSNVQVSNVPTQTGRIEFEAGATNIYVTYDYQNLCPGQTISRTIYRDGREVYPTSFEEWTGTSDGSGRLEYYQKGGLPLPGGEYTVTVGVEAVTFTISGRVPPTFGEITLALGVQPDGTPILTALDNRFDWKTKVVYAIFDYVGMSDGLRWRTVWMRNGEEEARQGGLWDVEAGGTEGTYWVTYHDEADKVLTGGAYSVTLYIENVAQSTPGEFNIIAYYVPPE